ncbi:MAG: glycine cleavage system aminomethyltransferase GcvT [Microscillaceae bacterium]|nr:glycine cleavage system aminomethyltransferase GcvT [Microscillaceae bacterium]
MELKKVALHHLHLELGAKMVEFAGFEMPVRYTSDKDEHMKVREGVGVFDVSHMGEFLIKGDKALDLIQKVVSNDADALHIGKVQYAYLPNDQGGVVDDLLVYRLDEQEYMLVVNASNIDKDWNWIQKNNDLGAEMTNISEQTSLFAVQGPKAAEAMQSLTAVDLSAMKYYTFERAEFAGVRDLIISATGYTGAGGFEIYVPNTEAEKVWKAIFEAGKPFGIQPIGLGARDTLRLEKGYCLYGNDIDDQTCPLEAGLGWVTKFNKDFINSESLKNKKAAGVPRRLIGFLMIDRGIPRSHYPVVNESGEYLGEVSSGSLSPVLNVGIGLAYLPQAYTQPDTEIYIRIRDKNLKAKVVKLPFV